jgi:hypothetical protein
MRGQTWGAICERGAHAAAENTRTQACSHILDWCWSCALCSSRDVQSDLVGGMDAGEGTFGLLLWRECRWHWMAWMAGRSDCGNDVVRVVRIGLWDSE